MNEKKKVSSIGLLDSTVKSAIKLTGSEGGFSIFLDRKRQRVTLSNLTSEDEGKTSVFYPPISAEITLWVNNFHQPRLINESDKSLYWVLKQKTEFDIDSVLCAPFKVRGKVLGLTGLIAQQGSRELDNRDIELLVLLNERSAAKSENLLQLKSFNDHQGKLDSLLEVESLMKVDLSLKDVFYNALQVALDLTEAQASSLLMVDRENQELVFEEATGEKSKGLIKTRIPLDKGIAGWVALSGKSLLIPDARRDHRFFKKIDDTTGFETRSIICVPLKKEENIIGVVEVINKKNGRSFTERDTQLLTIIAHQTVRSFENIQLYGDLKSLILETINAFVVAIDAKAPYADGHSERVMNLSLLIAEEMGLSGQEKEDVKLAALLHDVGKIGLDEDIIKKPSHLTDDEYTKMKEHPVIGCDLIKQIDQLGSIMPGIAQHHENYDGSGYPQGLKGEEISLMARIIRVAEAYDAMNIDWPYSKSLGEESALEAITATAETQFDPEVVQAFIAAHGRIANEVVDQGRDAAKGLEDGEGESEEETNP